MAGKKKGESDFLRLRREIEEARKPQPKKKAGGKKA